MIKKPSTSTRARTPQDQRSVLSEPRYAKLLRDVQQLIASAKAATDQSKVISQWNLGRRIHRERLDSHGGYDSAVLRELSRAAGVATRNLHYALAFHAHYATCPELPLNWLHYRVLLDVRSTENRARYQALAVNEVISARELQRRIRLEQRAKANTDSLLPRPAHPEYLYRATVEHVIDGDTLDLQVDLGFSVQRHGRFRLASIDCPEIDTPEGRAARNFVHRRLRSAKTIVVQTFRTDIYGRYVAHLYYSPATLTFAECTTAGTHLNAELLKHHHAELAIE